MDLFSENKIFQECKKIIKLHNLKKKFRNNDKLYKKIGELGEHKTNNSAFLNYENELRKSYSAIINKGDDVIDIGAHNGMHLENFINLVGEKGSVFGFEPLPKQFAYLKNNYPNANVTLVNKALSDTQGSCDFFEVDGSPEESGFLRRKQYNNPYNARPKKIEVSVEKLDNYLDKFSKISFMKLDAEGAELDILKGSINLLKKHRPIISIEYGYPTYSLYGCTKKSLYKFARKHNYVLSDLWGNIIFDRRVWRDACDSIYWDFFIVPFEKINFFKERINNNRENTVLLFNVEK